MSPEEFQAKEKAFDDAIEAVLVEYGTASEERYHTLLRQIPNATREYHHALLETASEDPTNESCMNPSIAEHLSSNVAFLLVTLNRVRKKRAGA